MKLLNKSKYQHSNSNDDFGQKAAAAFESAVRWLL